jgi:plastocyanin
MSSKQRMATFSIITMLGLAVTSGAIAVASVSAQYPAAQQSAGSGGNANTATGSKVSIVEGASTMADKAFSPSPIKVKAGDTVTWTNDDSQIHTVVSGTGTSDPNKGKEFDSSPGLKTLIAPKQTFSHKFATAGEFPYFCELHPTMVGKVVVS